MTYSAQFKLVLHAVCRERWGQPRLRPGPWDHSSQSPALSPSSLSQLGGHPGRERRRCQLPSLGPARPRPRKVSASALTPGPPGLLGEGHPCSTIVPKGRSGTRGSGAAARVCGSPRRPAHPAPSSPSSLSPAKHHPPAPLPRPCRAPNHGCTTPRAPGQSQAAPRRTPAPPERQSPGSSGRGRWGRREAGAAKAAGSEPSRRAQAAARPAGTEPHTPTHRHTPTLPLPSLPPHGAQPVYTQCAQIASYGTGLTTAPWGGQGGTEYCH